MIIYQLMYKISRESKRHCIFLLIRHIGIHTTSAVKSVDQKHPLEFWYPHPSALPIVSLAFMFTQTTPLSPSLIPRTQHNVTNERHGYKHFPTPDNFFYTTPDWTRCNWMVSGYAFFPADKYILCWKWVPFELLVLRSGDVTNTNVRARVSRIKYK